MQENLHDVDRSCIIFYGSIILLSYYTIGANIFSKNSSAGNISVMNVCKVRVPITRVI